MMQLFTVLRVIAPLIFWVTIQTLAANQIFAEPFEFSEFNLAQSSDEKYCWKKNPTDPICTYFCLKLNPADEKCTYVIPPSKELFDKQSSNTEACYCIRFYEGSWQCATQNQCDEKVPAIRGNSVQNMTILRQFPGFLDREKS